MRTNIDLDEGLLAQVTQACNVTTKHAAVEAALRLTVQLKNQEKILSLFGKIQWDGDLDAMRQSRFPDWGDRLLTPEDTDTPNDDESDACVSSLQSQADVDA